MSFRRLEGTWTEWCAGKDGKPDRYGWIRPHRKISWAMGSVARNRDGAAHETHPWFDFGLRLWLNLRTIVAVSVDVHASWHQATSSVTGIRAWPPKQPCKVCIVCLSEATG